MTVVDSFGKKIFDLGVFFFLFCVLFSPLSDPLWLWKERNGRTALKKKKEKERPSPWSPFRAEVRADPRLVFPQAG